MDNNQDVDSDPNDNSSQGANGNGNTGPDLSVAEILDAFRRYDGVYKREAIDAAIARKEEITPYLMTILENVLADPQQYADDQDSQEHIYAVLLLGHFKEPRAHRLIIDIFSLPDDLPYELFGEICTENLPMLLINTCGGFLEDIKSMILNKSAGDYCRASAAQALTYALPAGYADRKTLVEFFGTLFTGDEAGEDSNFWGLLAGDICFLYPVEIKDVIKTGYEEGLIFPGMIDYESFEEAFANGEAWCLERLRWEYERNSLDDLHRAMSWWACFNQNDDDVFGPAGMDYPVPPARGKSKKKKNKAKKKRKQAKTSRKKNRR